jgi:hypothetical protein
MACRQQLRRKPLRFAVNYEGAWKIRPILRPSTESVKKFL